MKRQASPKYPQAGIRISQSTKARAEKVAKIRTRNGSRKITMSEVLRWCIDAYLPTLEKKAQELVRKPGA